MTMTMITIIMIIIIIICHVEPEIIIFVFMIIFDVASVGHNFIVVSTHLYNIVLSKTLNIGKIT